MVKILVGGEKLLSNKVLIEPDFQTEKKTIIHPPPPPQKKKKNSSCQGDQVLKIC
jgi:hypothetical protein